MGFHESVSWGEVFPSATLLLPHRFTLPSLEIQETFGTLSTSLIPVDRC